MIGQQYLGKAVERRVGGRDLVDDIDAVGVLFQHTADPAHLPFNPVQAIDQILLLLIGAHLGAAAGRDLLFLLHKVIFVFSFGHLHFMRLLNDHFSGADKAHSASGCPQSRMRSIWDVGC